MSFYRPQFAAALRLLAAISEAMVARGFSRPVLVGGAAVEFYTFGAISTGDFDLCSPRQSELEEVMQQHGFVRPSGRGMATRGWIHPDLQLGFEIVGSMPLDGQVRADQLVLVDQFVPDGAFAIIRVEDLIADRMGQYASGSARDMLAQANMLLALHPDADMHYLEMRVRYETGGDYGAQDVKGD